jgi:hypothetical protein
MECNFFYKNLLIILLIIIGEWDREVFILLHYNFDRDDNLDDLRWLMTFIY